MQQRVPQLAAFMNGAGDLRGHVAGDAVGPGELAEQLLHPVAVLLNMGIYLGIGALKIRVGHDSRSAVTGPNDVHHVQIAFEDQAVQMHINEIKAGRCSPMTQQTRLDVLRAKRPFQKRIVFQINLPHRKIICRPPVSIHFLDVFCA